MDLLHIPWAADLPRYKPVRYTLRLDPMTARQISANHQVFGVVAGQDNVGTWEEIPPGNYLMVGFKTDHGHGATRALCEIRPYRPGEIRARTNR